jgi:hypothetical protein
LTLRRGIFQLSLTQFERLFKDDENLELERRLFRMLCLLTSALSIFVVIPINVFQNVPIWPSLVAGGLGLLTLGLYWLSRRGTDLPKVLFLVVTLALDGIWFVNGGSLGSVPYFLPVTFMLAMLYFAGSWRWVVMALLVLNFSGLLLIEDVLPQLIIPFASAHDRFVDLVTGLPIGGFACAFTLLIVLRSYHRERRLLQQTNQELARNLAEVRTLRGLLPICAWCRSIRTDEGLWTRVDQYLSEHTDAQISHGICPECEKRNFPEGDDGVVSAEEAVPGRGAEGRRSRSSTPSGSP